LFANSSSFIGVFIGKVSCVPMCLKGAVASFLRMGYLRMYPISMLKLSFDPRVFVYCMVNLARGYVGLIVMSDFLYPCL